MGSEPQYAKWPLLPLSQHVFTLTNPYASAAAQKTAAAALKAAIAEHKMAPLYRYLAHPLEGVLNVPGEGVPSAGGGSLIGIGRGRGASPGPASGLPSGARRPPSRKSSMVGVMPASSEHLAWDEALYAQLKGENDAELDAFQREEDEAVEKAGDTEIMAARGKRAEFWARVGDKDRSIAAYEDVFEKTGILGTKIDLVLAIIRMGLFFGDRPLVKKHLERAKTLVDAGGDWDRRNRLKAYEGLHLLTIRAHAAAAPLLLDSLSTFTSYELCTYSALVVYSVLAGSVSLKRVDFKSKVVDAPEIKAILGEGEDKLLALSGALSAGPGADDTAELDDNNSSSSDGNVPPAAAPTAAKTTTAVNLAALSAAPHHHATTTTPTSSTASPPSAPDTTAPAAELALDFSPLADLVSSLYSGSYKDFFGALARVEEQFLTQDRYLNEHRNWYIREMRLRAYQQLLQSYRVVGLDSMAHDFGVTVEFLDRDLAKFIAAGRIPCTIDRVSGRGVIETNRPDDKNKQYQDVVRLGDQLITKLQKYGQAVRLRGSERA